jgi:phosphonate transport system substrate-binding protein
LDCSAQESPGRAGGNGQAIVFGRVSDDPKSAYPDLELMAGMIAPHLSKFGYTRGAAAVASSNREMIRSLAEGKIDVISESAFSALEFEDAGVADILLLERKRGAASYGTVFFSRKDAVIGSLDDLMGKKIGFEDPGSTTSFRYPMLVIKRSGLEAIPLSKPEDPVPPDKVGYLFFRGELNIAVAVVRKKVHVGAFSDRDWKRDSRVPRRIKDQLRIFHRTATVPRSLLLVRKDMSAALRKKIRDTLLQLDTSDPGVNKVLRKYYRVRGYSAIDAETRKKLDALRVAQKELGTGLRQ